MHPTIAMTHRHLWAAGRLGIGLALLLTLSGALSPVPAATLAQPGCGKPQTLSSGAWEGLFQVELERRWTTLPIDAGTPGARVQARTTVRGSMRLEVSRADANDADTVTGTAVADFRSESHAVREDGRTETVRVSGSLSGGSVSVPRGTDFLPGDQLEWWGAWRRGSGPFAVSIEIRQPNAMTSVFGDGPLTPEPLDPIRFAVEAVTCTGITGTVDPEQFAPLVPDRVTAVEVITSAGIFQIDRQ